MTKSIELKCGGTAEKNGAAWVLRAPNGCGDANEWAAVAADELGGGVASRALYGEHFVCEDYEALAEYLGGVCADGWAEQGTVNDSARAASWETTDADELWFRDAIGLRDFDDETAADLRARFHIGFVARCTAIEKSVLTVDGVVLGRDITSLDELAQAIEANAEELIDVGADLSRLPRFGGEEPEDTTGIWSWDEMRLLVGDGPGVLQVVPR